MINSASKVATSLHYGRLHSHAQKVACKYMYTMQVLRRPEGHQVTAELDLQVAVNHLMWYQVSNSDPWEE